MANEPLIQSANFKKDYVTALAVGLFVIIVLCELCVAIGIPVIISHTTLYAEHGVRQTMLTNFDFTRMLCRIKPQYPHPTIDMERELIRWDLDLLSSHIRDYNRTMPMTDVEAINEDLRQYGTILAGLNSKNAKPFCNTQHLKFDKLVKNIENKLDTLNVPQNKKTQGKK